MAEDSAPDAYEAAQEIAPKSSQELMEIHRRSTQDGIERIAGNTFEPIALQAVFGLEMSDAGFDGGATLHPSPECSRCSASFPFVHMHRCLAGVIVAAIAHVHVDLADSAADQAFNLL